MSTHRERDEKALKEAIRDLNNAVYRVLADRNATTLSPNLNLRDLQNVARMTDRVLEEAPWVLP